jgi:hypothetical protein
MIVPVTFTAPLHPVNGMVYENVPHGSGDGGTEAIIVPLIVITFPAKVAEMPGGKPVGVPIPIAPVVAIVIGGIDTGDPSKSIVGLLEGIPTVHAADEEQGTPVQFSKAAFFQRTLISSKLKEDLRLIPSILSDSWLLITWPFRLIVILIIRPKIR